MPQESVRRPTQRHAEAGHNMLSCLQALSSWFKGEVDALGPDAMAKRAISLFAKRTQGNITEKSGAAIEGFIMQVIHGAACGVSDTMPADVPRLPQAPWRMTEI